MNVPRVWVISPFSSPYGSESSDRYRYICQALQKGGANVVQFISSFDHALKCRRRAERTAWRVVQVYEPGYRRNVSLKRLYSHGIFDLFIGAYFLREAVRSGVPSAILIAVPHNGAACVASLFGKLMRSVRIVDIHDTWPESILGVHEVRGAARLVFWLWKALADLALLLPDHVFAESKQYAQRGGSIRQRWGRTPARCIYLGGDPAYYRGVKAIDALPSPLDSASFLLAYVGTLGANYDLDSVMEAFRIFSSECKGAGLMMLGAGEREAELREWAFARGLKIWFSGRIPHVVLLGYLKCANIGLNAFRAGGNVAYSYKCNDYLLSGVPVINSLKGETAEILEEFEIGFNYNAGDVDSLVQAMRMAKKKWDSEPGWRAKVFDFANNVLNRERSYRPILESCLQAPTGSPHEES